MEPLELCVEQLTRSQINGASIANASRYAFLTGSCSPTWFASCGKWRISSEQIRGIWCLCPTPPPASMWPSRPRVCDLVTPCTCSISAYYVFFRYGSVKKMAQAASAAAAGRGAGTANVPGAGAGSDGEANGGINVVYGEVKFPIRGVQVLVDGAHALGQLHVDLRLGSCGSIHYEGSSSSSSSETKGDGQQARPLQQVHSSATATATDTDTATATIAAATVAAIDSAASTGATGADAASDAAEGTGQVPGNVAAPEPHCVPDYFVTNCHKWLCAPRGSAVLWIAPNRQACVRPLVVSHGSGCGFTSDFIWDGCRDYAPYLATSSALALWRRLGPPRVRAYCRGLLKEAVAVLTRRWGTDLLAPSLEMCGCMALVELPGGLAETKPATSTDAKYVQDLLHHVYAVECPVKCIQGRLYVRISVHIYNILADYERLAEAVEQIAASGTSTGGK
ncbi:hypothetical protein Vretifemale_9315 [Volvox reticuliferus]|uniref:Aminotransferase class V domain-containing protein n=1 Tax=Volvox reticuliferus TaxID=1737510 RepID=A0A8J4FKH6_9CHLO|nr:hypothetical protein Vretifemale_9315 [Volvox reticuliferus]